MSLNWSGSCLWIILAVFCLSTAAPALHYAVKYQDAPCQHPEWVDVKLSHVLIVDASLLLGVCVLCAGISLFGGESGMMCSAVLFLLYSVFHVAWLFVLGFSLFGDSMDCKNEARGLWVTGLILFIFGVLALFTNKSSGKNNN